MRPNKNQKLNIKPACRRTGMQKSIFCVNLYKCAGRIVAIPGDCKSPAFGHRWFESNPAHKMNSYKIFIPKQILVLSMLAIGLDIVRIIWFDSIYFIYLLWNIFLAFIPLVISSLLLQHQENNKKISGIFLTLSLIIWLFFFPNAPYLVTDMIHLGMNSVVPRWYDALVLFSTAWVGILLALHSLSHVEKILLVRYSKKVALLLLFILVLASSFGIYMGRVLRWNSWDIILRPKYFFNDVWAVFYHPWNYPEAYIFTFSFFFFILISYQAWKFSSS